MPELPEVEVIKQSLIKLITNATILKIKICNGNLRYKLDKKFKKNIENKKILKILRRSKYLVIKLSINGFILIHLGMSGKFFLISDKDNKKIKTSFYYNIEDLKKHNHIYFYLSNKYTLVYNDPRRFGFLKFLTNKEFKKSKFISKLGPEPLSYAFNYIYFKNFILNKNKNIKNLLMDQRFVSGLGNIYVNEALFLSKINPFKSCVLLSNKEINVLIFQIKKILKLSIKFGGSSIRDFTNISGKNGSYQQIFKVYGRHKLRCLRVNCNGIISKVFISNRSSFYCQRCQL